MKKRAFSVVVSLLLLVAMVFGVSGCGNTKEANKTDGSGKKAEKFVFWDKSEYVKAYNDMMKQKVEEFGKKNNIDVEYVVIAPNDLKTKLMASIEAKNPPDLVVTDDFLASQFVGMNALAATDSIMGKFQFTDAAKTMATVNGKFYTVPEAFLAPGAYLRKDKLDAKGLKEPETWQELKEMAEKINDPAHNFYALGFPMGASGGGDAEGMMRALILDFGGSPTDKDGNITINSPQTLEALKFVASLYQEKLCPPSAVTWDDSGNNNAYLAGTVGYVHNSGSIVSSMAKDKPDLQKNTELRPFPKGPAGSFVLGGGNVFTIFSNGKNPDAAKKFVDYFFSDKDYYQKIVENMGAMWQPVVKGYENTEFWQKPENKAWLENSKHIVPNTYPEGLNDKASKAFSSQLCVKAVQRIVVNKMDPQKSLDQLEAELKKAYGK